VAEESQYLSFQGIRVHFRIASCEDTPRERILLLSSPLISTFHWRKIVPELTQLGCMVVLIDLPGFGRSDCGMDVPQDNAMRANMIWGVLDEIDRRSQAPDSLWHLAGHGSACATILRMANLYPDSTKSQIHISPNFSIPLPKSRERTARWFDATVQSEDRFRSMIEHYCGYPLDDYILDRMRRPLLRPGAREMFLRMLRHSQDAPADGMGFCPTMALWGGRDELMDARAVEEVRRLLPDAETHVLKSAGHFPMETHSRAIRDYLRGWIRYND